MNTDSKIPEQIEHELNLSFISPEEQKAIKTGLDMIEPSIARNIFRDWLVKTIGEKNREIAALKAPAATTDENAFDKISTLIGIVEQTRIEIMGAHAEDVRGAPDDLLRIHQAFSRVDAALSDASEAAAVCESEQAEPDLR